MSSFSIPDFSADFGRDSGNFNFQTQKARSETADRDSIRDFGGDSLDRKKFESALRDAADARESRTNSPAAKTRDKAPIADALEKDQAEAVVRDVDAGSKTEQLADGNDHAAPEPAGKAVSSKLQAKGADKNAAAETITIEAPTQVVIATKLATPPAATQADALPGDAGAEKTKTSDQAATNAANTLTADVCAVPQTPPALTAQATDANAAMVAALLNGKSGLAQAQDQNAAADALAKDGAAQEPALLGAPKQATLGAGTAQSDAPNPAAPGEAAQAEAFNGALGNQQSSSAKPAAAEKSEPGNQSAASNASSTSETPGISQQAATPNSPKPSDATLAKETIATKLTDVKVSDGNSDDAQFQQLSSTVGTDGARRPTAASTTHAANNTETVAKSVVHFFRQSNGGNARFEIRLDPVELGRVDARVEVNSDKTVSLTLSADRPETLQELMRTARELEKQLSDSGMKLSEEGVKFRLNADTQNGQGRQNAQLDAEPRRAGKLYGNEQEQAVDVSANITLRRYRAGGVDVMA